MAEQQIENQVGDQKAKDIIALRDREKAKQSNFRSMWQSVADLIFPQTFGLTDVVTRGSEMMQHLYDTTAVEEAENMASGLVNNLFPAGQQFFALKAHPMVQDSWEIKRWLSEATETVHEQMFNSNFIEQVSNTIHYWLTFGIACNYSEWTARNGLAYRDYAIGTYQCIENSNGVIDTNILSCPMTARQIVQDYGEKSGKSVLKAYEKPETKGEEFNVIHLVRPRKDRNPDLINNLNMPWESVHVQERDQIVLDEGGYEEFPFSIPRYQVVYREVYGRGRGTAMLPQVRVLNRLAKDYMEMSNKWVNPPKEVLESFEGTVDVTPGALNYVTQIPSIQAIEMGAHGAYPITKDILEYHRESIRQGFLKNAFEPITPLTGDRRVQMEIVERLKEGMKKLSKPIGRLFVELLTPVIERTTLLLIRNGVLGQAPAALQGTPMRIEFINPLALALRDQQSRGLQYWVVAGMQMSESERMADVLDNVDYDTAYRDLGEALGVKAEHIRPIRDRDKIRAERAETERKAVQLEMAGQAADIYQKTAEKRSA